MAILRRRKRDRPIRDAADEAAETMDAAEWSINRLTPQIEGVFDDVESVTIEVEATLKWFRSIKGWHRVIHWGNIFYPSRWGKPFTTVELIFEEV